MRSRPPGPSDSTESTDTGVGRVIDLGEFALWMALPLAVWGSGAAFLGGARNRSDFVYSAERSAYATTILLMVAAAGLGAALVGDRFELAYVHLHSAAEFPPAVKWSALWAGEEGALLVRLLGLSLATSLSVWMYKGRLGGLMPWTTGVLQALVATLVVILLVGVSPFARLGYMPADGMGAAWGVGSPWAVIHAPALHLGMGAIAVPFALAVSTLLTGKGGGRWADPATDWALIAWVFLTVALLARARWAYEVAAQGEIWTWDPAEAVLLATWLATSAVLYVLGAAGGAGSRRLVGLALAGTAFGVSWVALTVTRTGFGVAGPELTDRAGPEGLLLVLLAGVVVMPALLLLHRLPLLRDGQDRGASAGVGRGRDGAGIILAIWAVGIAWGALLPILAETLHGSPVTVGAGYFRWLSAAMLLLLLGVASLSARRGREEAGPLDAPADGGGLGNVGAEVRRWGGRLVHVGFVVALLGGVGTAMGVEALVRMMPGDSVLLTSPLGREYALGYEGTSLRPGPGGWSWVSLLSVRRSGAPMGTITTERRVTSLEGGGSATPGILTRPLEDLHIRLEEVDERLGTLNDPEFQGATFLVRVNPLASWIWLGGILMGVGGLLSVHGRRVE